MRKTVSMRCMIASDAACVAGGFIAAVLLVHLAQTVSRVDSVSDATIRWQDIQSVNRTGKSDRLVVPFEHRFGQELWVAQEEQLRTGEAPSARGPVRTPAAGNTTIVPKGLVAPAAPAKSSNAPVRDVPTSRKPEPSRFTMEGCDPLASPLVEPDLARFAGRCLTELPVPTRNSA
jgi:hypothetical protein